MFLYKFEDYNALFDLVDYTRVRASLFFKLIRNYHLKNIDELYTVCKKKLPKKERIITSNIDSHISRALDLLLYPKTELILPVARFYGKRLKDYLKKQKVVNKIMFTKELLRGSPVLNSIDLLVDTISIDKLKIALEKFYLFEKFEKEDKKCIIFRTKRGQLFNIYLTDKFSFGNSSFYLSFSESVMETLKKSFSNYDISYDYISNKEKNYKFEEEHEIFKFLHLQFIPYELRWDDDVIKKAIKYEIPELVNISDIKGDFHIHTIFSDGEGYIEDVVQEGKSLGYNYIAITEHSINQKSGNGINVSDWSMERALINFLNKKYSDFNIFSGLEVDILKDGSLDFPYEILKKMDVVLLALHHPEYGTLDPNDKIAYAIKSEIGSILAHPKDRYWGREPLFSLDLPYLFENAKRHSVALEISSIPDRIGFTASEIEEGKKAGIKFAINSDAHAPEYLKNIDIGIVRAKRGWLTKNDIINTYSFERLIKEGIIMKNNRGHV